MRSGGRGRSGGRKAEEGGEEIVGARHARILVSCRSLLCLRSHKNCPAFGAPLFKNDHCDGAHQLWKPTNAHPSLTSVFFTFTLEIWITGNTCSVFRPGDSEFMVKNIKKLDLVGPQGGQRSGQVKFFKSEFFSSDLDSLQKSIIAKCSSFFYILIGT